MNLTLKQFDYVAPKSGGFFTACANGNWFHLRSDGSSLYKNSFRKTGDFSEGFARAKSANGWCHIKPNGLPLYKTRFDLVTDFRKGKAFGWIAGEKFLIRAYKGRAKVHKYS